MNARRATVLSVLTLAGAGLLPAAIAQQVPPAAPAARQSEDREIVARVSIRSAAELAALVRRGLDLLEVREGDDLFALTTRAEMAQLEREGWQIRLDVEQTRLLSSAVEGSALPRGATPAGDPAAATFRDGYRTVAAIRQSLMDAAASHPGIAEFFVYGQSWERVRTFGSATPQGHDLFGITLTKRCLGSTAPCIDPATKPTFFLMAAIHARELSVPEIALRYVDYLLGGYGIDPEATWLLDEHRIVVVPMINPDGRVIAESGYLQRKNTNYTNPPGGCANPPTGSNQFGIDLNRNSSFRWGLVNKPTDPVCGQTYPGPNDASEPEIQALQSLVRSLFADQRGPNDADVAPETTSGLLITLHSYSDLVLWPWGTTSAPAPNAAGLSTIGGKFASYNGYRPQQSINLYPTSGTTDEWAYGELGIAAYTFEVGPSSGECGGFFPPLRCLDGGAGGSFWARNLPALLYAARVAGAPYQLGRGPAPESLVATRTSNGSIELRARFDDRSNGGQTIAAADYYVGGPPWRGAAAQPLAPADRFDTPLEDAVGLIDAASAPPEGTLVYARAKDANDNWGPVRAVFIPPASCTYAIDPTGVSAPAAASSAGIAVSTGVGCGWTATSGASWIAVAPPPSGTGTGGVSLAIAANTTASARVGTVTIAGLPFTVSQAGATCSYTISPTSRTHGSGSGSGSIAVTAPNGCSWTASSSAAWVKISSGATGTGNGTVKYAFTKNPSRTARSATLSVATRTFTLNQKGR